MKISCNTIQMECFDNGDVYFLVDGVEWKMNQGKCFLEFDDKKVFFDEMDCKQRKENNGIGDGIRLRYSFEGFTFETFVWIERSTNMIYFELIPIDFGLDFKAIYWPKAFEFDSNDENWMSLVCQMQGIMIPNTYENEVTQLNFDGQFCSNAAYMPWFGQIKKNEGYLMIAHTPWDMAYQIDHPAYGPYTHLSMRHLPSLGKLAYRRVIKLIFDHDSTIVSLCKRYRKEALENGKVVTLKEKAARNENVDRLIGSAILHKGIKTHVVEESIFYDKENKEKNDLLISFKQRANEIRYYHEKGIKKLYLHLDGWGDPGYDNCHPDYLPACIEAGGWEGLKELSDTLFEYHDLFGLHDQYRDYYFSAPTFDSNQALMMKNKEIFTQTLWAGGKQSYLCASFAPNYVKRNFEEVLSHGIRLQASYLDVFTCNELDECFNEHHLMTRKQCQEYREQCFYYLHSKNILPSSEEVNEWALKSLVFCHYGPYDFMLRKPTEKRLGIPVPLFNLVYHDCVILPWPMDITEDEDYMLYALLNGGAAYVDKDGAYPNVDGAFDSLREKQLDEEIKRYRVVSSLQEKVAKLEMTDFGFIDSNYKKQYSVFGNKYKVIIDLEKNTYEMSVE